MLTAIHFAEGSDVVATDDPDIIHDAGELMLHRSMTTVRVEGRSLPSEANGEALSARRAANVVRALTDRGVEADRLVPVAVGSTCYPKAAVSLVVTATRSGPLRANLCPAVDAGAP